MPGKSTEAGHGTNREEFVDVSRICSLAHGVPQKIGA